MNIVLTILLLPLGLWLRIWSGALRRWADVDKGASPDLIQIATGTYLVSFLIILGGSGFVASRFAPESSGFEFTLGLLLLAGALTCQVILRHWSVRLSASNSRSAVSELVVTRSQVLPKNAEAFGFQLVDTDSDKSSQDSTHG